MSMLNQVHHRVMTYLIQHGSAKAGYLNPALLRGRSHILRNPQLKKKTAERREVAQKVDGCGHMALYEEGGTLTSKNYPGTYPNYTTCEVTIKVPAGKNLHLKFADLDLDYQTCEAASLKIYKGANVEYETSCGHFSTEPKSIFLDTNIATVRFESGLHVSGRGFLINYASSDHPDLITCLTRGNHYEEKEYSKYCPAGCRDVAGDISGDVAEGYRDTSLLCKAAIHAGIISDELGGQIHISQLKGISRYRGMLANGILSKDGSLSDQRIRFNNLDCRTSLTAAFGADRFSATSSWEWTSVSGDVIHWTPEKAQLNTTGASWASNHQYEREYLEMDFGERKKISGIISTGSTLQSFHFYVKSYILSYRKDGPKWRTYKGAISNEEKVLEGNSNYLDQTRNNFIPPIVARYLRIVPQTWHQRIALKVELAGCSLAQNHNSSTHPMWKKTNILSAKTPTKEDKSITDTVPSETHVLGWLAILVTVLLVLLLFFIVAVVIICFLRRKRANSGQYKSADKQDTGCWKQLEQPFVRRQSAEFTITYGNHDENDKLPKFDPVKCDTEDYQEPPMIGTGLVTRKGSTFKPMDTEVKDYLGSRQIESHYDCPQSRRHEYALPLSNPEPEYATPIIERRIPPETMFTGYNIPVLSPQHHRSFSQHSSFSVSTSPENSGGDYQTPHSINLEECDYDKPKVHGESAPLKTCNCQTPPPCSLVADGYSSPRDCLLIHNTCCSQHCTLTSDMDTCTFQKTDVTAEHCLH